MTAELTERAKANNRSAENGITARVVDARIPTTPPRSVSSVTTSQEET